jgi:outer membrane protein assembly factor BamB
MLLFFVWIILAAVCVSPRGKDQPQWGQSWSRNMVSDETGLPTEFEPKAGKNLKWIARLGSEAHSTPVVAAGRAYIGTNNNEPRNPKHQGDRGVLMCFDEKDGTLLWQLVVPKRSEDPYFDWPNSGISSPATVEGERVYIVSNRGEVLCLDARGMTNGNDGPYLNESRHQTPEAEALIPTDSTDADIIWAFDMTSGAGIWSHDGAHTSILIDGDFLYLNTGTGVDNTHRKIRTPDAPSLIVLDKKTGRFLAREREGIAPKIFHCTWSAPSLADVNGRKVIFFAGGNGIVYAFETLKAAPAQNEVATLKKIWHFDPDPNAPKEDVHRYNSNRREGPSNIFGMPVFFKNRVYVAGGGDLWWGKNEAWIKSIDASRAGDLTRSGEIWSYPLDRHTMSTPAVTEDLLFIADCGRLVHCLDRKTGRPLWTHEAKGEFWASPYIADRKMYIGSRRGDFLIFAAAREKKLLSSTDLGAPISATAVAANGVLYVATMTHLYALQVK